MMIIIWVRRLKSADKLQNSLELLGMVISH